MFFHFFYKDKTTHEVASSEVNLLPNRQTIATPKHCHNALNKPIAIVCVTLVLTIYESVLEFSEVVLVDLKWNIIQLQSDSLPKCAGMRCGETT